MRNYKSWKRDELMYFAQAIKRYMQIHQLSHQLWNLFLSVSLQQLDFIRYGKSHHIASLDRRIQFFKFCSVEKGQRERSFPSFAISKSFCYMHNFESISCKHSQLNKENASNSKQATKWKQMKQERCNIGKVQDP